MYVAQGTLEFALRPYRIPAEQLREKHEAVLGMITIFLGERGGKRVAVQRQTNHLIIMIPTCAVPAYRRHTCSLNSGSHLIPPAAVSIAVWTNPLGTKKSARLN